MKKEIYIWDNMAKAFHVTSNRSRAHKDKYLKIAELILALKPTDVLDLGCGSGILEKELYEKGYFGNLRAVDASVPMLDIARSLVGFSKYKFINSDIDRNFGVKKNFDVIVSINLLFFLDFKKEFFKRVEKHLKNQKSIFILVVPKPSSEASNMSFLKEHFKDTNWWEKILILADEIFNIPFYIKMLLGQRKVEKLEKKGIIDYDTPDSIKKMAKGAKLRIIKIEEIHARQNWLLLMRRAGDES